MSRDGKILLKYFLCDFVAAIFSWFLFNLFRYNLFRATVGFNSIGSFLSEPKMLISFLLVPLIWGFLYFFSGYYLSPRRKTNLGDILNTAVISFIGILIIFFVFVINDYPENSFNYYLLFVGGYVIHFLLTELFRSIRTTKLIYGQRYGKDAINIVIIGAGANAMSLRSKFNIYKMNFSRRLEGFILPGGEDRVFVEKEEILGSIEDLGDVIKKNKIEEIIVALDSEDKNILKSVIDKLYIYRLPIKIPASEKDIIWGKVSLFSLFGIPFIDIIPGGMSFFQNNIKIIFDKLLSAFLLVVLSPLFLYIAFEIKRTSAGPVFYLQERVGRNGCIFKICKFRSMYVGAENGEPLLADKNDKRITSFGYFLRKYRLDELPQFWNVLKGDMSIVGPRPEREYFVKKIVANAPYYHLLQGVRPGITSWGIVKCGYANTVAKMIGRSKYDMLYIENQSVFIDIKIMFFTLKPLIMGKGV